VANTPEENCPRGDEVIDMLKRHAIQVLRRAGAHAGRDHRTDWRSEDEARVAGAITYWGGARRFG
jgi:hypothetical protein